MPSSRKAPSGSFGRPANRSRGRLRGRPSGLKGRYRDRYTTGLRPARDPGASTAPSRTAARPGAAALPTRPATAPGSYQDQIPTNKSLQLQGIAYVLKKTSLSQVTPVTEIGCECRCAQTAHRLIQSRRFRSQPTPHPHRPNTHPTVIATVIHNSDRRRPAPRPDCPQTAHPLILLPTFLRRLFLERQRWGSFAAYHPHNWLVAVGQRSMMNFQVDVRSSTVVVRLPLRPSWRFTRHGRSWLAVPTLAGR